MKRNIKYLLSNICPVLRKIIVKYKTIKKTSGCHIQNLSKRLRRTKTLESVEPSLVNSGRRIFH